MTTPRKIFGTRVCQCGCGLLIDLAQGQANRTWAKGCPNRERHEQNLRNGRARRRAARMKLKKPPQNKHGGMPVSTHKTVKHCTQCLGLTHRRPTLKPCKCGGSHKELPPVRITRSA